MKTIIIGYADANALTAAKVICGIGVPDIDQSEIISAAQDRHKFPDGIKRIKQFLVDDENPAFDVAFISDDVARFQAQSDDKRLASIASEKLKSKTAGELENNYRLANKVLTLAANRRNAAISAVAAQQNILSSSTTDEKTKSEVLAKIAKLQPAADAAAAVFDEILADANAVKNPKSAPEAVSAAVEKLKAFK